MIALFVESLLEHVKRVVGSSNRNRYVASQASLFSNGLRGAVDESALIRLVENDVAPEQSSPRNLDLDSDQNCACE